MKRKASEGSDDQTLPIKRTRTDGKEVNFSTLTFPQKLWHIVGNETYKSIGWHQWGTCIVIDVELFSAEILSQQGELKIFETSVMKSFMRQLNLYGFKKIRSLEGRLESTCMDQMESTFKVRWLRIETNSSHSGGGDLYSLISRFVGGNHQTVLDSGPSGSELVAPGLEQLQLNRY